jgi:hypothetical protein
MQGFSLFHNHAFKPIPPEIPPPVMALVEKPGKIDLDLLQTRKGSIVNLTSRESAHHPICDYPHKTSQNAS